MLPGNLPVPGRTGRHNQLALTGCRHLELVGHLALRQGHNLRIGKLQTEIRTSRRLRVGDYREKTLLTILPLLALIAHIQRNPLQCAIVLHQQLRRVA